MWMLWAILNRFLLYSIEIVTTRLFKTISKILQIAKTCKKKKNRFANFEKTQLNENKIYYIKIKVKNNIFFTNVKKSSLNAK